MKEKEFDLGQESELPYKIEIIPGELVRLPDGGLLIIEPCAKPISLKSLWENKQ